MLEISNLSVEYQGIRALHHVSLEIKEGEVVSIIGSNGSGKSTLLKAISGLVEPVSGKIIYHDREIQSIPAYERQKLGISLAPEGRGIFRRMTVYENLLLGAYQHKSKEYRKQALERVYRLFHTLKERSNQYAETLSGGEQQMLSIAICLMSNPKLLMLDEPSLGLAPRVVDEMFRILKEQLAGKITILLVEQNACMALSISDRAYILENSRIVLHGDAKKLLENDLVKKAYLGM